MFCNSVVLVEIKSQIFTVRSKLVDLKNKGRGQNRSCESVATKPVVLVIRGRRGYLGKDLRDLMF